MITRILAALVMAPVVVALTLWLPTPAFAALLALVLVPALHEWSRLSGHPRSIFLLALTALLLLMALLWLNPGLGSGLVVLAVVFWLVQVPGLLGGRGLDRRNGWPDLVAGVGILLAAWAALVMLHRQPAIGPAVALGVMVMVWAADSFAYFCGRLFGRRMLAPAVSPNKTVEGVIGGALATMLAVAIAIALVEGLAGQMPVTAWMAAALVTALVSVAGDLYESRLKRNAGVKDSGSLIPGHGGVLDRIDGLLAAAPVFAAIWLLVR